MKSKTILIVDDMEFDRELVVKALSRKLGCTILGASNGAETLEILANQRVDMVLLDVEMPQMSGQEVLMKIRETWNQAELPVIMISGESQDSTVISCLRAGANDYINKPIKFEVAMTRILNHVTLAEFIRDRAKLQEAMAVQAMIVTYNHEINNPLSIALGLLGRLEKHRDDDLAFRKIETSLHRIADIVQKIAEVTDKKEVTYEAYTQNSKMIKIR